MTNEDQTLEGSASEAAEGLELAPQVLEEHKETGVDPLDEISDPAVRAEAKKHRAIARRHEKPEVKAEEPKAPASTQEFLTKADFHKSNERKAIRDATADAEVKANWNEIVQFYTPRRGKETPEDIKEDIQDAITLFNARNVKSSKDDSAAQLSTTTVVKSGGGGTKETPKAPALPNLITPAQPKDWYPKKS